MKNNYLFNPASRIIIILALLVAGCGSGSDSDPATGQGTLRVHMTDAPACGYDAVNVTVNKVRVHKSSSASENESGWTDITLSPARKINLLNLTNGVLDSLGQTSLEAGHYTQLRLVLDENTGTSVANSITLSSAPATEIPLITPSAAKSGIKLNTPFDIEAGQHVDLVLDFDACKSIVRRGNNSYALKPVIKILPFALNGISGFVDTALFGSAVMVTAQQNGMVVQTTAPLPNGSFVLSRLAPGIYDVVLTADGHVTAVIGAVAVDSSTSMVNLNNNVPITLPASSSNTVSGTVTLNPPSTEEVAHVTAQQPIGSSPITIKSVTSDATSGAYSLSLPSDAPQLAQYDPIMPIVFVAQSGVAGTYTIEASATGYQAQSAVIDISTAASSQDFTLVP